MHYPDYRTGRQPTRREYFREVRAWLSNHPAMQGDRTRLAKICCAPRLPVQLQRAPRPASLVA